jgi:hypothetical protein
MAGPLVVRIADLRAAVGRALDDAEDRLGPEVAPAAGLD